MVCTEYRYATQKSYLVDNGVRQNIGTQGVLTCSMNTLNFGVVWCGVVLAVHVE
jgi:hypothetical protein